jgi:hypothetical protein
VSLTSLLTAVLTILRTDPRSLASRMLAVRRAFPFGQFGQANDTRSDNGATGCTDTCIQFLLLLFMRRWYTHDQIRGAVGHRNPKTGLSYPEVNEIGKTLLRGWYRVITGLGADAIISIVRTKGPVMIGEMYTWHPEWRGYRYAGVTADGRPNGYAHPSGEAGKTQLAGFVGRHAVVLLAVAPIPAWNGRLGVYVLEPNHGSAARPEKVPYDVITIDQAKRLITNYAAAQGKSYAFVPTRTLAA